MTTSVGGVVRLTAEGPSGLLWDKLEAPGLDLTVVRRRRVDQLMEQAARHRVTLVTGPAGAGKTVACASWASELGARPGSRLVWLTLDAEDREPDRFWHYLILGLAKAGTIPTLAGEAPGELLNNGRDAAAGSVARQLVGCLVATHEPTTVVLDDVHLLAGSPALAGLDELIHHAPPELRLVLAGRYVPGLALAKLRLAGQVAEVGAADLACTGDEADSYLQAAGVQADPGQRAAIMRQTEGWMAGLRMLSMSAPAAGGPLVGDAADLVTDYLRDEVLSPLPSATRQLLLRTCLTDTVPADLAHWLTGDPATAARIDQLSRENALIGTVAAGRAEYRYHPMLKCMLQTVLRREHPSELIELLGKVARWHAGRAEIAAAIKAAGQAGDWEFGLQILHEAGPVIAAPEQWAELEEALAAFPPALRSNDAVLACALAAARLWQADADGALPHLECAQGAVTELSGTERVTGELWLAALQAMRLAGSGADLARQWSLASRAHEESRSVPEHRAVGLLWLALGCAYLRRLQAPQAMLALQHAGSQLAAGDLAWARERGRCWQAVAHAAFGDLTAATRLAGEVADGPARQISGLGPILAFSQSLVHIARDEPEVAAMLLDQAEQEAAGPQPAGEPALAVLIGLARTRIAIDDGNLAGARGLVRLVTELTAGDAAAGVAISRLDAEISLAAGEQGRARATLAAMPAAAVGNWPEVAVSEARLLMAEDDDKGALRLLDPVMAGPVGGGAGGTSMPDSAGEAPSNPSGHAGAVPPGALHADALDAGDQAAAAPRDGLGAGPVTLACRLSALLTAVLAYRRLNQATEAAERLEEALALAEPDEQWGPFITAGSAVRSALTVLITPASPCAAFAGRILERFDGRLAHRSGQPSGAPLTEAELAVLRFLPSHMTNQEIAESLFLSINTIKTHLSSVYRKLGVTSRRQAIAQGRRLDLLLWLTEAVAGRAVARTLLGGCGPLLWPSAGRPPPKAPLARLA